MLRFLSLELCNWAFARRQVIPLHECITLLVGPNGSGKTSFLDAFKLLLGSDRLYKKRNIGDYIERQVDKAAIIGRFDNRPVDGHYPFGPLGIFEPVVTLTCRMLLSSEGKWERDYAITPGEFNLDAEERRVDWHRSMAYQQLMEKVGVSKSLLRVISLNQGSTDEILQKDAEELCQYILEISGDKKVMEHFNTTREDLIKTRNQYEELAKTQNLEKERLKVLEGQVGQFRAIQLKKRQLASSLWHYPIAVASETEKTYREFAVDLQEKNEQLKLLDKQQQQVQDEYQAAEEQLTQVNLQFERTRSKERRINEQREDLVREGSRREPEQKEAEEFIKRYEQISERDLRALEHKKQDTDTELDEAKFALRQFQGRYDELALQEAQLDKERRIVYPNYVKEFRGALSLQGIDHKLLAECIEITDNRWRKAIESLLGRERFTVILEPKYLIPGKKVAEKLRYSSYVQKPDLREIRVMSGSALEKIKVLDPSVAGCLHWLNNIMLVEDVEEGHRVAERGIVSLTDQAYRQDSRGGISVYREGVYCGKLAIDAQLEEVRNTIKAIEKPLEDAKKRVDQIQERLVKLIEEIEEQKALRELPSIRERYCLLSETLRKIKANLESLDSQKEYNDEQITRLHNQSQNLAGQRDSAKTAAKNLQEVKEKLRKDVKEKTERIPQLRKQYDEALAVLQPEQKELLAKPDERERLRKAENYQADIESMQEELEKLNEEELIGIEERYKEHRARVDFAEEVIKKKQEEIDDYRQANDEAQEEYADMVTGVFNQLRKHLEEQAEMAALKVKVHINRIGEARWSLDYQLSFNGKPFRPYFHKKLSGGQAVIAALLLLIAAIKVDGAFSFMILDEPTAHLDAGRMRVVGEFLRRTGAQYLLAVPYSENIKHLGWVDMTLNFRLKDDEEELAPPIFYGVVNEHYVMERTGKIF
ncbi:AAA family ATPase [Desulfitobacterium chlororespirans]|uniref:Nuclease SbcCD subunit C n=1 Tax=Desulfitobacterium chlororespirans DSM 11544 TaxID=1121395 RepID=A0A1M7RWP8_9FIRM|nr:AAA family ATPase [Desulfitobacterium chlororespirans]SHN50705.1 RecF/RecN/SMC N terminal domain-containing protein [Desulfitobacterium chlororespirans DSM 11544]